MKRYLILLLLLVAGAVLFEGFQCVSPEMTTARVAAKNNDWVKVEEFAGKELGKSPKNGEATFLLAKAKQRLNKLEEAARLILEADRLTLEPVTKQQVPLTEYLIWTTAFNTGITQYNNYFGNENKGLLDSAIHSFEIALILRPENAELYRLIGRMHEEKGEEEKMLDIYRTYTERLKKEIDWARSANIFLMMPRKDVLSKLGRPPAAAVGERMGEDSVLTDNYPVMGIRIYIYYSMDENKEMIVEGWRVNPPADWLDAEKQSFTRLDVDPFGTLALHYFNNAVAIRDNPNLDSAKKVEGINENIEKSKDYTKIITMINPTNVDANRFLVQLYEAQGKSEYALEEIAKLVERNPDNKFYLAQYGELFMRLSKYDDAITQYQRALQIDAEFCDVLRNIAAAYKNKAVIIIQAQEDKKDRDKNYKENPEEYKPLLIQSAELFKKSRNCEKYKNDLQVMSELANLYFGLSNLGMNTRNELNLIVDDMERLEQAIPDDEKEVYWLKMCKILGDMQSPKSTRACQEAQKFIK